MATQLKKSKRSRSNKKKRERKTVNSKPNSRVARYKLTPEMKTTTIQPEARR